MRCQRCGAFINELAVEYNGYILHEECVPKRSDVQS